MLGAIPGTNLKTSYGSSLFPRKPFFLDCYWILHPVRKLALILAFSRAPDSPILSSWAVTAHGKGPMEYLRWDFWTIRGMSQQIRTSHSVIILMKAASASTLYLELLILR